MSYEVYKVMHIVTLFLFFAGMGSIFLGGANSRVVKIMTGVSSLLILVGGMGLIARIGIKHGEAWPKWLLAKVAIWLLLAVLVPVLGKRIGKCSPLFFILWGLGVAAAIIAVYQPF